MNHARVISTPTGWVMRYLSGPMRAKVMDLFDTDTLPLPLTATATLAQVRELLEGTPGTVVDLDGRVTITG